MLSIFLVGAGAMGRALAGGWKNKENRADYDVYLIDPHIHSALDNSTFPPDRLFTSPEELPNITPDIVVFSVKPQSIKSVIPLYNQFQNSRCSFISIAAGTSLDTLKGASNSPLQSPSPWVRVMPNLSATVGCGVTGLFTDAPLSPNEKEMIRELFLRVGEAFWVNSEDIIDRVTAISGSGPAYFFRFVESLTKAALDLGFTQDQAELMARETFLGAAALLKQGETASTWRQRVTSPDGTTAAAMDAFERGNVDVLVKHATQAAYDRAKELVE